MKNAWKIKGFQRDETHRKCTQNHSGDQDRGKLEISLWLTPHVGSNPTRSAKKRKNAFSRSSVFLAWYLCGASPDRCRLFSFQGAKYSDKRQGRKQLNPVRPLSSGHRAFPSPCMDRTAAEPEFHSFGNAQFAGSGCYSSVRNTRKG